MKQALRAKDAKSAKQAASEKSVTKTVSARSKTDKAKAQERQSRRRGANSARPLFVGLRYHGTVMASRPKQAQPRPAPRLYLVTPPVSDPAAFASELMPVIEAADVAAVLLRLADADERTPDQPRQGRRSVVQDRRRALSRRPSGDCRA